MRNYTKPEIKKIELETIDIIQASRQLIDGGSMDDHTNNNNGTAWPFAASAYDVQ